MTASARLTRDRQDSTLAVVLVQLVVCAATASLVAGAELPAAAL
ncbi:hypothetical protein [Microbacterium sp. WCS2018Hpa-9]|nr:hypothetical protein [Microbacterium sp. WCS2018Hpa-9]